MTPTRFGFSYEMKHALTTEMVMDLPVHDADLVSIRVRTSTDGSVSLELIIEIDPEESMRPFLRLGVGSRLIALEFSACWQIRSNLICFQTRREQIFDWQALPASDLITSLSEHGA